MTWLVSATSSQRGSAASLAATRTPDVGAAVEMVMASEVIAAALAEAKLEDKGKGRWARGAPTPVSVAWLEQARVLVVASDDATLNAALAANGAGSFKASPHYRARRR